MYMFMFYMYVTCIFIIIKQSDLMDSAQVDTKQIDDYCEENNFIGW